MALDNIVFNDEMVISFARGNVGTIAHMVVDETKGSVLLVPHVESFTPEIASVS